MTGRPHDAATASDEDRLAQGTLPWFEMVAHLLRRHVEEAGLPADLTTSLVERYTDGGVLLDGRVRGLRIDVVDGRATVRVGVTEDERGEVTIEVTTDAARRLNLLRSADPRYAAARREAMASGEMRVTGAPGPLATVLDSVHDPIVDRTA